MATAPDNTLPPAPQKRRVLRFTLRVLAALCLLGLGVLAIAWWLLRSSLPQLDGKRGLPGLASAVQIERDASGVPTIEAARGLDAIRALGFLHAQERFFQMDLLRRKSAGTLAELFGSAAVSADKQARRHRFLNRAEAVWAGLPPERRARLAAYTAGVNAGLHALGSRPWEYYVLRAEPEAWRETDSLLIIYTMWLDLQDEDGRFERTIVALRKAVGETELESLAPAGDSHDAPLDGSVIPPRPLPVLRAKTLAPTTPEHEPVPGSNAFAVAGRLTAGGAALVASDMHLGLSVPNVWYRAVLKYPDATGRPLRLVGVTLPGVPNLAVGSNGRIAWGFTNSYIDTVDIVPIEVDSSGRRYRTPTGWQPLEEYAEPIRIKGEAPASFTVRWTQWGPLVEEPKDGRALAVKWNAYDSSALNLEGLALLEAGSVDEALAIVHRAGMPNQNFIVGDASGHIAWTVAGRVPERAAGFSGLQEGDWAGGKAGWTGWLSGNDVPVVENPAEGLLWSANNRHVGGEALRRLGDNGYDHGYRAGEIHDRLREAAGRGTAIRPADLAAIQLDDRMPQLLSWRDLLVATLAGDTNPVRQEIRELARTWSGRAEPQSAGYRLVRDFCDETTGRVLAPFLAEAQRNYRRFNPAKLHTDELVLRLLRERPADRLDPHYRDWAALLREAVATVETKIARTGRPPRDFIWGDVNILDMRHPLSRYLPGFIARRLDMPAVPLAGDADSPRNQTPRHGASERLVVSPGREEEGLFQMPGGQSGHPLSPYYRAGHEAWVNGEPAPLLPGTTRHRLELVPK